MSNHIKSKHLWLIMLVIGSLLISGISVSVMALDDDEHDMAQHDEHGMDMSAEHTMGQDAGHDTTQGRALFVELGCTACHGEHAEGTEIAPPLPGLAAERIQQQVRAPINIMPVFGPDMLPNAEFERLVAYLTGLPVTDMEHSHDEHAGAGPFRQQEKIIRRYWLALFSLAEGDVDEAIFNIEQINAVVIAQHQAKTQQILANLSGSNLPAARQAILGALAGIPVTDESSEDLRIQLARFAILEQDTDTAIHDLRRLTGMEDVISLIEASDFAAAGDALGTATSGDDDHIHGVDDDHGDDADHDDEHAMEHDDNSTMEHDDEHAMEHDDD